MAQEQEPLNLALDLVKFVLNYRLLSQILKTVINIYLSCTHAVPHISNFPVNVHRQLTVGKEYLTKSRPQRWYDSHYSIYAMFYGSSVPLLLFQATFSIALSGTPIY